MTDRIRKVLRAHKYGRVFLSTVSGVASTKKEMISYFDRMTDVDIITTKSFQVLPNPGNREPVICQTGAGNFGNSVGLRNPGLEAVLPEIAELRKKGLCKLLNVSLSASSPQDFITLIRAFDPYADSVELNFSCPHAAAGFGASIGSDITTATEYVRQIRAAFPEQQSALIIKLTPNVDNIGQIARSLIEAGADGIAAINTAGPFRYTLEGTDIPILNNSLGGKGGASGRWVFSRAIECIREIRQAVGDEAFILGMGGVCTAENVRDMIAAGADAVGLGSVFGTVRQQDWPLFISSVKEEAEALLEGRGADRKAESLLSEENRMEYRAHKVLSVLQHSPEMLILTLDGSLDCRSGEFAFLFVPGIGEKPFSVAHNSPLTFLIRKRGYFTSQMFSLKEGDTVYVRGLYGKSIQPPPADCDVLVIAGGSGVAVVPSLCRLIDDPSRIDILVGTSASAQGCDGKALFEDYLKEHSSSYTVIPDDGKPGRVLDSIAEHAEGKKKLRAYLVGPEKFMAAAAGILARCGVEDSDIYLSLERSTLCGIGLCGECVCGDRLTCQWGTFQSYEYILSAAPQLLE